MTLLDYSNQAVGSIPVTATLPHLTVASPTDGATVPQGPITVTGTITAGSSVKVSTANGNTNVGTVTGTRFTVTFDEHIGQDTLSVEGRTSDGQPMKSAVIHITVDAPATVTVGSPSGTTAAAPFVATRRTVVVSGTSTGSTVTFTAGATALAQVPVVDGSYTAALYFNASAGNSQTITVSDDAGADTDTVYVTLPAPPTVAVPVITSPTAGQSVSGSTTTFTGTALPGTSIELIIQPKGQQYSQDPTAPVLIGTDGKWSISARVPLGDYQVFALDLANSDGSPVIAGDNGDNTVNSDGVAFHVVTASAAPPAGGAAPGGSSGAGDPADGTGSPTAADTATALAYTGSFGSVPATIGAGLLLLVGTGLLLLVARRRRRLA